MTPALPPRDAADRGRPPGVAPAGGQPAEGLPSLPAIDVDAPGVTPVVEPPEGVVALLLAWWATAAGPRGLIHVARSETRAERLARAAHGFAPGLEVVALPPWDCLPCDRASPSRAAMGRRIAALRRLTQPPPEAGRLGS